MNTPKNLSEDFLQFVWEHKLYNNKNLKTIDGSILEIIHPGKRNIDAGPDFFNARIKTGNTIWAGNIEIHRKASYWIKHNHHNNKDYDNVILHIVEENDKDIKRSNGNSIPTLIIKYPEHIRDNYKDLQEATTWIACEKHFHRVNPIQLQLGFNRLLIERLENKTNEIISRLVQNNNDWNETFYQMMARMFGFKVNAVPFELLAKALPMGVLAKHKNSLFQLEALLYGCSGLLNEKLIGDEYFLKLRDEFSFLYKKYKLRPVEAHLWKFLRLRPNNFPTIRISQFAALIFHSNGLFSKIIEANNINTLTQLFKINASDYWNQHYNFNKPSKQTKPKELGSTAANLLIINLVIPFLFVYGEKQNNQNLKNRALDFLEQVPAEKNTIIHKWSELGVKARSAFDTQALLQLKNCYCEPKKCLNCHIGAKLVSAK